ncbi:MAG: hypothetical protein H0U60_19585 [Blastocatellia bacterium]|nr:hypothetical protein [Blastocatellia bacterium]
MGLQEAMTHLLNLNIEAPTWEEGRKKTAIDLFSRAASLEDARRTLSLSYTYEIIQQTQPKVAARKQLGMMSAEILEVMRDEMIQAGIEEWKAYQIGKENYQAMNRVVEEWSQIPDAQPNEA